MRFLLYALAVWMPATTAAHGIECLNGQSPDILAVEQWELQEEQGSERSITITLQPRDERGIRLIDGTIRFEDVLGERIGEFILNRAEGIPPAQPYIHTDVVAGTVLERLEQLHPDDVATIACVSALVYDDGTLEEFTR